MVNVPLPLVCHELNTIPAADGALAPPHSWKNKQTKMGKVILEVFPQFTESSGMTSITTKM